jgi:hypothetical protein
MNKTRTRRKNLPGAQTMCIYTPFGPVPCSHLFRPPLHLPLFICSVVFSSILSLFIFCHSFVWWWWQDGSPCCLHFPCSSFPLQFIPPFPCSPSPLPRYLLGLLPPSFPCHPSRPCPSHSLLLPHEQLLTAAVEDSCCGDGTDLALSLSLSPCCPFVVVPPLLSSVVPVPLTSWSSSLCHPGHPHCPIILAVLVALAVFTIHCLHRCQVVQIL